MAHLQEKISTYLENNNISFTIKDFVVGNKGDVVNAPDIIVFWDESKLGVKPTDEQLDSIGSQIDAQRQSNENKKIAVELLSSTDWTVQPDITTGTHKLTNQTDFIAYRNQIRAIAVNPTANVTWPNMPTENWSS